MRSIAGAFLLLFGAAAGADAGEMTTTWPASLPCARPRSLALCCDQTEPVTWSNAEGKVTLQFDARQLATEVISFPKNVDLGRLARIRVSGGGLQQIRVSCGKDYAQFTDSTTYLEIPHLQSTCDGTRCTVVEAVYPLAHRLRDHVGERLRGLGPREPWPQAVTCAMLADGGALLASACPRNRCVDRVKRTADAIAQIAASSRRTPVELISDGRKFADNYHWTISVGEASVVIRCSFDGDFVREQCSAELATPDGTIEFDGFHVTFDDPPRKIRVVGASTVYIDGDLLRPR